MFESDADDFEIYSLQKMLAKHGISREELDLSDYAGLTYRELKGLATTAIKRKKRESKDRK